jgi:hypothetical protein
VSSRKAHALLLWAILGSATALAEVPLDDPMRPPSEVDTSARVSGVKSPGNGKESGYHLSAIRIRKESRSATINGKSVTVGEHIGAARVVAISAASVTLKQNGRVVTIPLLPLSIKTPVEAKQP